MIISRKLSHAVGCFLLNIRLKKQNRFRNFHNFDSAREIGVIFNASLEETYVISKKFINYLRSDNNMVYALGFVEDKEKIGHFPYSKGVDYFSIKNLNWYGKPKNEVVSEFIERPLDLLIDISQTDHFAIKYVVGISLAKTKITRYSEKYLYDIQLKIDKDRSVNYLIDQVKNYLSVMKKSG